MYTFVNNDFLYNKRLGSQKACVTNTNKTFDILCFQTAYINKWMDQRVRKNLKLIYYKRDFSMIANKM